MLKRLVVGSLLAITFMVSSTAMAGDTLKRVIDSKVLKVGMTADQPPMNAVSSSGQYMGYDVDLANALAGAMQVKLEIVKMPFGDLMTALEKGKIDMVASGMAITPERSLKVSFVGPYIMSGKSILTKNSVLAKIESSEEFNRKDLKLVALKNSTSSSFISAVAPDATLIEVADYEEGVAMVINGTADAMVADMPACMLSILRHPDAGLATLSSPVTIEPIGIAISKKDPQFLNLIDNYLETYSNMGLLEKLNAKWFVDKSWIAALPR
ncbi:MAG: ABC transporter substrate-binding protein [Gammaproteobacteria bacterium]|nr:MAG: ABC transporter substrate-binding protein [Gammaproteobacteria bacterium]RLA10181.1 MAG: ABC transporter substrate-binding protein [Gammaproteobacteria bacterium]RLA16829.1 MAG: ABC transporter substrate-binding protein [Gammaproteobacteria bacterium]